jgi:hypothetical protein
MPGFQLQREEGGMRLYLGSAICLLWVVAGVGVLADSADLSDGVFIAHAPSDFQYTSDPPGGSWCAAYAQNYAITSCEQQDNEIDSQDMAVWYVLSAWTESKDWCGTQFGFGDYDADNFIIMGHGACFPSGGLTIPSSGWPGPNEGIALTTTDENWSGNFQPVYWIAGYAYGEDVISLGPDPDNDFAGWAGCEDQLEVEATALGAMGLLTDGIYACPEGSLDIGGDTTGQDTAGGDVVDDILGDLPQDGASGVCCVGGECMILTEEECAELDGGFLPAWDSCEGFTCPTRGDGQTTWYVQWNTAGGIQSVIDQAQDGDIIILVSSVHSFTGPGNWDLEFGLNKNLTVRSDLNDPEQCVIERYSGSAWPHGFWLHGNQGNSTLIKGIKILNGHAGGT